MPSWLRSYKGRASVSTGDVNLAVHGGPVAESLPDPTLVRGELGFLSSLGKHLRRSRSSTTVKSSSSHGSVSLAAPNGLLSSPNPTLIPASSSSVDVTLSSSSSTQIVRSLGTPPEAIALPIALKPALSVSTTPGVTSPGETVSQPTIPEIICSEEDPPGETVPQLAQPEKTSPTGSISVAGAETESLMLRKVSTSDIQSKKYSAWRQAFNALTLEDREELKLDECDIHDCLDKMREATQKHRQDCAEKSWTYSKNGDRVVLRDIADKMINWIDRFKAIGDTAVAFDPVHAALPWAGFRFLLEIATADVENRGAILVGLETVENLVGRCAVYEYLYLYNTNIKLKSAESLQQLLVGLYTDILVYLSRSKYYFSRNAVVRTTMAMLDRDFAPMMRGIEEKANGVHSAAQVANMEYTKAEHGAQSHEQEKLMKLLTELETPILRMELKLQNLCDNFGDTKRLAALQWISTAKYVDHRNRAAEDRLDNSGCWLLEKPEYKNWRKKSSSALLWLHGIPGAGKTKLVSLVVDTLIQEREAGSQEALAYFFCDRGEPGRREPKNVLRAIVKQLSSPKPGSDLLPPIARAYKELEKAGHTSELGLDRCSDLILELLSYYPQCNIVIDALDECDKETRLKLIAALTKMMESASNLVKIFVSSREDADITTKLRRLPGLRISATDNSDDIKRYIETEIGKQISDEQLLQGEISDDLKNHVINTLIKGSDGMFMWAVLQIKNICDPERFHVEADIREELGKLPTGLKDTYSSIFRKIASLPAVGGSLAINTLKWIMCAERPLRTTEMIAAISAWSNDTIKEHQNLSKDSILRFCHNLVVWDSEQDVFRFAHLSVREYLDANHFTEVDAHAMAAEVCLSLLCLPNDQARRESNTWIQVQNSFRQYFHEHWAHHTRASGHKSTECKIYRLQVEFFHPPPELSHAYLEFVGLQVKSGSDGKPYCAPLLTAVYYRLLESVRFLLLCPAVDINAKTKWGNTALMLASEAGWTVGVQLLLDNGANPHHESDYGDTGLLCAAQSGNKKVVQLFFNIGLDVHHTASDGWTALLTAAFFGKREMVQFLLDKCADPNYKNKQGESALFLAIEGEGSEEDTIKMVQLLLDKEADPNYSVDETGSTALLEAAKWGYVEVVQLLLDKNADPNHRNKQGKSALFLAIAEGECDVDMVKMVQLLLDKEADPNDSVDETGSTALLEAAKWGYIEVVQLLLDRHADLNHRNKQGKSALFLAITEDDWSDSGGIEMAQLLLDKGADPNYSVDETGSTALLEAAKWGYVEVVQLLLDRNANPNHRNKQGKSALCLTFECKWFDEEDMAKMVQLLLDKEADPNYSVDETGSTALLEAAKRGYVEVVQLLLDKNADPNHRNKQGKSALFLAIAEGEYDVDMVKMVQLLLDKEADPNDSVDKSGSTALLEAAKWGYIEVVQLLLDRNADPNHRDKQGKSALFLAIEDEWNCEDMVKMVQLLLDKEADPNDSVDETGSTALLEAAKWGYIEVIQLLLDRNADPNHRNNEGETALFTAAVWGHENVIQLLMRSGANACNRCRMEVNLTHEAGGGHRPTTNVSP